MVIVSAIRTLIASSLLCRRPWTNSALSRSVLLGIVPQLTRIPPTTFSRSTSATRLPARAAWIAARSPPGPPPMTTTSKLITGAPSDDTRPAQTPDRPRPVSEAQQQLPDVVVAEQVHPLPHRPQEIRVTGDRREFPGLLFPR